MTCSMMTTLVSASLMILFLDLLRTKYGGARGYFKKYSGFTDEELDSLIVTMTVDAKEQR